MENQVTMRSRVHLPCAACKMLRRRCDNNCLLSPYFPSEEMDKFAGVHKVFGASNVIRMIRMVEETKREDAVKAIVYEATARLRDPVYGSCGAICHLQKMIEELRSQLETTNAQVLGLKEERDQLLGIFANVHYLEFVSTRNDPVLDAWNSFVHDDTLAYDHVQFPSNSDWNSRM
ncbi:hypothetical protein UlMin_021739 [Ulmus minor]